MKQPETGSLTPSLKQYLAKSALRLKTARAKIPAEPLAQWALSNILLDGAPFSFEGHEYLRDLYDETAPHVVVQKAAQVGGTTWAILKSLHACLQGHNVIYYSPTRAGGLEFSRARLDPLIDENPLLRDLVTTDTAGFKRVGDGRLYLHGTRSVMDLKSVPGDMVVLDELDEVAPKAKQQAKARLHHSPFKFMVELSNPSVPDFGIHEAYQRSDQRHWLIKCPGCSHWADLEGEFPSTLGQDVKVLIRRPDGVCFRACPRCAAELDIAAGQWVPKHKGRDVHGYLISQLISSRVDPGDILFEYENTRFAEVLYNLRCALPYSDLQRRLEASFVLSLCGQSPMLESSEQPCLMGVDTGKLLYAVILRPDDNDPKRFHLVKLAVCRQFEELDDLMRRYKVRTCVIDAQPELHLARQFASRHRGKVFLHHFNEHQRGGFCFDWKAAKAESNRTEALDASRAALRDKLVSLPRAEPTVELFARHVAADAKRLEEDPDTGSCTYRYFNTGENHFSMAFTYCWIAAQYFPPAYGVFELYRLAACKLPPSR